MAVELLAEIFVVITEYICIRLGRIGLLTIVTIPIPSPSIFSLELIQGFLFYSSKFCDLPHIVVYMY